MKHKQRRTKTGEMLMDVTKYLLTIGLIGGIMTDKVNLFSGLLIVLITTIVFIVAFLTIPPERKEN